MSPPISTEAPPLNRAVEQLIRVSSLVVRSLPTARSVIGATKQFCVRSVVLRRYRCAFDFNCSHAGVRWSASGFPDLLTRHLLLSEGTYQDDVVSALKHLIHPGDLVFDVGAHHGLMAVVSGIAAGESGRVVSFEPNPQSRAHALRHIQLNGLHNVVIEDVALSDRDGSTTFYAQTGDVSWNSTLMQAFVAVAEQDEHRRVEAITVKTQTLDNYVRETGRIPTLIKIDTEGSEWPILQGGSQTLLDHRPVLVIELNPVSAESAGVTIGDYVRFLGSTTRTRYGRLRRLGGATTIPTRSRRSTGRDSLRTIQWAGTSSVYPRDQTFLRQVR